MIHLVDLEKRNGLWSLCGILLGKDWSTQILHVTCPKCHTLYNAIVNSYVAIDNGG